ncbi:MAG: radical SAM protein [Candidatus Sumerlaeota bacterium]|nr:radical SAM protein [Candidatus Sumerlaeota bacterium]
MARVVFVTLYNPGAAGARYVGASLRAAGHDVWLLHFKEFRYREVPSDDAETRRKAESNDDLMCLRIRHPGKVIYLPFPNPITQTEQDLFISELRRLKPDLIGFSIFTVTAQIAAGLTGRIHKELPGTPVLWGGIHPLLDPEDCIQKADIVCTGEGEDVCVELLRRWDEYKRKGALDLEGLWFREKGGAIVRNARRPPCEDLDHLPFPFYGEQEILVEDSVVSDKYNHRGEAQCYNILVFTERGCPYQCSYCIHSVLNEDQAYARIRRRTVDNVLAECEMLFRDHGMRHFIFHDEIFIIQKEWIREFATKFRDRFFSRGCTFTGYVHPLTTDADMLQWMWEAGLRRTGMGIQSGCPRVAKEVFHRPFVPEKTIEMSRLLALYPFEKVQYEVIVANVFETEAERRETFEFLLKCHPPFDVEPFDLVRYPTSKLGQMTPPDVTLDENEMTFWNMLYFMTGYPEMDRWALRKLANNVYYRQNARELERLTTSIVAMYKEKRRLWNENRHLQETNAAGAGTAGAVCGALPNAAGGNGGGGWRLRLKQWLEKVLP